MSAKPAAIPLFGDAYLADTRHLTTEEHGAYLLLMMAAWRQDDCALPDDDRKLARITGLSPRKWASIKPTIMEFWQVEDGRIFQGRLRKERAYVDQKSESNRKSAEARWGKQPAENKQSGECDRISERNAPPPSPPQVSDEVANATPSQTRVKRVKSVEPAMVRMTADWQPSDLPPTVAELAELWPPGRLQREAEQFRDYWLDRTDRRPGWDRTFHNRIRDIHDRVMRDCKNGQRNGFSGQSSTRDIGMDVAEQLAAKRRASSGIVDLVPSLGPPRRALG